MSEALASLLADRATHALLTVLNAGAEEARIVGGAVRNVLMGMPVCDIDITTTCLPEETTRRAKAAGWRVIPTGIAHGTVTVLVEGRSFEVTTLREDIATDGRHAQVRFGRDFQMDAARRDFTINALSLGPDGKIHDYFGGLADIAARHVRFIGDADQRLREDYLRGLRFLRFSAEYGDGMLDDMGLAAILRQREGFAQLSRERVRQEMLKLVMAPYAEIVMERAETNWLLSGIVGLPLDLVRFRILSANAHNTARDAGLVARLFALFIRIPGDILTLRASLRLSNDEASALNAMVQACGILAQTANIRLAAYRYPTAVEGAILLQSAPLERIRAGLVEALNVPVFLIRGADILARGVPAGPSVGRLLEAIEARWIAAGFPQAREDQDRLLDAAILGFKSAED